MVKKIILFLLLITMVTYWSTVMWWFDRETPIHAVILDKTVPDVTYREHKGFMWLLNNLKYINSTTGQPFVYSQDYYGFFPLLEKKYAVKELPDVLSNADLIYITDTYGVYTEDFYGINVRGERSKLMYGGLQENDVSKIEQGLHKKNMLIAEFNTLATPSDEQAVKRLQNLLGVKWTGWIGRYFTDLSPTNTEIPIWLIDNYEKQYCQKWLFNGPGFAVLNKDDTVIILQAGKDVGDKLNRIVFSTSAVEYYKVAKEQQYDYWFDIVEAAQDTQVLANYYLDVTAEGEKKLKEWKLPKVFPAVVKREMPYRTYYFAGDYADNNAIPERHDAFVWRPALGVGGLETQKRFYWQVYFPLMKTILQEVKHEQ